MQYIVTEIHNGCHLATLSRINQSQNLTVVHYSLRFHKNGLETFQLIPFTYKNKQAIRQTLMIT